MKKVLLIVILLITTFQGFSQTKGISYQAVILSPDAQEIPGKNAQGNILANSVVAIQFTIVDAASNAEYQEYHTTSTDRYGMINLLIGTGSATSNNDFTDIAWDGTTKRLKIGIDFSGGTNFSPLSEQNLSYMPQPVSQETTQLINDNFAANASDITINTTNIATNVSNIAANTTSILLKEDVVNKSTNVVTDAASDIKYPSVKAIKTYIDAQSTSGSTQDATTSVKGIVQLAGDLTGTAIAPLIGDSKVTTIKIEDAAVTDSKIATGISASKVGLGNVDNIADIDKPISTLTQGAITAEETRAGLAEVANTTDIATNAASILLKEDVVNKSTNVVTDAASDIKYPSVKAIKTYVDANIITGSPATATNTTNIATNVTNIATNTTDIATNASSILLKEDVVNKSTNVVTDAASDIKYPSVKAIKTYVDANIITGSPATATNTTNIATNVTNIATNTTDIATNASSILLKEDVVNKSTNVVTDAASDIKYPSVKAVKTYVDTQTSAINTLVDGKVYVGDGSNQAQEVTLSGDATITNAGVMTISNDAVTDAKISAMAASKLTGTVAIANGGTGAATKAPAFDALSPMTAAGDLIYGGTAGTGTTLPKGTASQVLTMNAGATAPEWKTASGGSINDLSDGKTNNGNVFLGNSAGSGLTTGMINVGVGIFSLQKNTLGSNNSAFGTYSLQDNMTGHSNSAFGSNSLRKNTSLNNSGFGANTLQWNTTGTGNTAIGVSALNLNVSGSWNTAIGAGSQTNRATGGTSNGNMNTSVGYRSLQTNDDDSNVAIGYESGFSNTFGKENTFIGTYAGHSNTTGINNVFLGFNSGYNETGSNKLYIENSNSATPLIYGEFNNDLVRINGKLEVTGTVKIEGGTPGAGKVLTSDANGLASWETAAAGATKIDELTDGKTPASSVFLGSDAGLLLTATSKYNTGVGDNVLKSNTSGLLNTAIGYNALKLNTNSNNTAVGGYSLDANTTGTNNTGLGYNTLSDNSSGALNTAIGSSALANSTSGSWNVSIGSSALYLNTSGEKNVAIGASAGNANYGSYNVFLGYNAGSNEAGSNKLYIENSNSATPLIYGEFDNDLARINGKLEVTGTVKIEGGTPGAGKILTSDATGLASWETNTSATEIDGLSDGKTLGNSIFLGSGSGGNFTAANGYNIGMGEYALSDNVNGYYNVAIGVGALEKATGHYNTALGSAAGATLVAGNNNIFLGTQAGRNASGSNKLYIEPTDSATPLIYGEFDNDLARINGKLEVTGTVKIEGGTPGAGKVLTSDANGLASWETPAAANSTLNTFNTATYAVLTTDNYIMYVGTVEAGVTVTLPTAVGVKGKEYTIKNMAATNVTIATTSGQEIWQDAAHKTTTAILGTESQNNWIKVISDGLNWISFRALY